MKKTGKLEVVSKDKDDEKPSPENFEDILEYLGGFGKFQCLILVMLLVLEIPTAFVTFIPIFVGKDPDFGQCYKNEEELPNEHETADLYLLKKNEQICSCNETFYADSSTIVSEWKLICDSAWVSDFITSIQMLGMLFGNTLASQFADWYGRKYGFLVTSFLLCLGSSVSAVAPNPYVYAMARLFCGAGISGFINITSMASMEFVPPKWRSVSNSIGPTGEGIMILSVMAYFIRPWRTLYWSTTAPFLLVLIIYPVLPESPRWLIRNKKIQEAHKVFELIAKINGTTPIVMAQLEKIGQKELDSQESQQNSKKIGYLDFFRDPKLRRTTLFMSAIWCSWSITYYGISYNIKNVKGNIYIHVFFLGLANSVGQKAAILINNRIGRRKSLFVSMTLCALFLVALAVSTMALDTKLYPVLVVVLCLMGVLGMSGARSAARLLSGESFPTAVRTMGLGIGGVAANFGGVICPQLAFLGSRWPSVPFFVFAAVSVSGSLISFLMDETTGKPLEDELQRKKSNHSIVVVHGTTEDNYTIP